jgi:cysteine desulfurase
MEAYLDNAATTRCLPEVGELMKNILCEDYGNPSALHRKGLAAERYLHEASATIASHLKVSAKEIIFTSGGTEADNLALIGAANAYSRKGKHLITTVIEHPAVTETMKHLESQGFEVTSLPVDKTGVIDLEALEKALRPDTILVSIMQVNNEIGSLQPIAEAGALLRKANPQIVFHVDAVQGFAWYDIHPQRMNVDLLSVSAHKFHGPKGVGFLYKSEKTKLQPLIFGGGQQSGWRSGTENVPAIAGMAKALELLSPDRDEQKERLYELKAFFCEGLRKIPALTINSPLGRAGVPHIVSARVAGVKSEVLLHALEEKNIYVSTGSACSSRQSKKQSATLQAIGLDKEASGETLRFSFSRFTTREELAYTLEAMNELIPSLRRYVKR